MADSNNNINDSAFSNAGYTDNTYQNAGYQNSASYQNGGYQSGSYQGGAAYQNGGYQNSASYQNNDYQNSASYQNSSYQGGTAYQNSGYQGDAAYHDSAFDNAAYQGSSSQNGGNPYSGGAQAGGNKGQIPSGNTYTSAQISGDVFDDVFVERSEVTVATIGNGLVLNVISGEGLKKEQAVLSDKRLYYNHRKGIIDTTSTRECVNVSEITGTKITDNKRISLLILAGIFFIAGLIIDASAGGDGGGFLGGIILAVINIITFFVTWNKYLDIEYPGGRIRMKVKKYNMANIIAFQKSIYRVKDAQMKDLYSVNINN